MPPVPLGRATQTAKTIARHLPFAVVEPLAFPFEALWQRAGIRRPGRGDPSVILFTLHKVASTFTHVILGYLNDRHMGLRRMDWDRYIHNRYPTDTSTWLAERQAEIFASTGYLYGPFRAWLPIPDLGTYRILLILRDPRDILTSAYFSEAFSHSAPFARSRMAEFEARRERVQNTSIDEFVLGRADDLFRLIEEYREMSVAFGVPVLTYETMLLDFDSFLDGVEAQLKITITGRQRSELRTLGQIGQELGDDPANHLRKGTPGDHRDKLAPRTVERLTATFAPQLEWMRG